MGGGGTPAAPLPIMFRVSIAVHNSPEGVPTVICCSSQAEDALEARNKCTLDGEVGVFLNVRPEKVLKNRVQCDRPESDSGQHEDPSEFAPKKRGRPRNE